MGKSKDLRNLVPPPAPCTGPIQTHGYVNVPGDTPAGGKSKHGYVNVPEPNQLPDWLGSSVPVGVQRTESTESYLDPVSGLDAVVDLHGGVGGDYLPMGEQGPSENYMPMGGEGHSQPNYLDEDIGPSPAVNVGPTDNYMCMGPDTMEPAENYMTMGDDVGPTENYMTMDGGASGPDEHYMNMDSQVFTSSMERDGIMPQPSYIPMDESVAAPQKGYLPMDGSVPPKGYLPMDGKGRTRLGGLRETVADVLYDDPNKKQEPGIVPKRAGQLGASPKKRAETCHFETLQENKPLLSAEPSMDDDVPMSTEALICKLQGKPKPKPIAPASPTGEKGKRHSYINDMFAKQSERDKVEYYAKSGE